MSKTAKRKRHVIACARVSKGDDASSVAAPAPKPPAPAPTPSRPGVLRPPRPTPSREFSGGSFARALRQATLLPAAARAKHYNHNDYGADADDVSEPSHIAQGTPAPPAPKTVAMRGPKTMKSVTIVNINDLHKGVKRDGLAKAKRLKKGDYGKGSGTGNSNRKAPKCTAGCGMRMGAGSSNKTHQTWKCGQCGTQTVLPKPAKKSLDVASDVSVTKHINTENDTMTKSNLEELFSDELAKSIDAEPAIITCPHCDCGITKSQVLEKAKKSGKKLVDQNNGGKLKTGPGKDGAHNKATPTRPMGAKAKTNDVNPGAYAKSEGGEEPEAETPVAEEKPAEPEVAAKPEVQKSLGGPRAIGGSQWSMFVHTGEDERIAKSIEQGLTGSGVGDRPSHVR